MSVDNSRFGSIGTEDLDSGDYDQFRKLVNRFPQTGDIDPQLATDVKDRDRGLII